MVSQLFCGPSATNPCKAACRVEPAGECYDTVLFPNGGERLKDGAICLKDSLKGVLNKRAFVINNALYGNLQTDSCKKRLIASGT